MVVPILVELRWVRQSTRGAAASMAQRVRWRSPTSSAIPNTSMESDGGADTASAAQFCARRSPLTRLPVASAVAIPEISPIPMTPNRPNPGSAHSPMRGTSLDEGPS